jgi:hypothetical protein
MPDWWISSRWVPLEESDEEKVDDEELFIDITDRDNNDRNDNDNDNDNDNNDNNDNYNASSTTAASSTITDQ